MTQITGESVCGGIAFGTIKYRASAKNITKSTIKKYIISDTKAEHDKYLAGRDEAICQLNALYEEAVVAGDEASASIFDAQYYATK